MSVEERDFCYAGLDAGQQSRHKTQHHQGALVVQEVVCVDLTDDAGLVPIADGLEFRCVSRGPRRSECGTVVL